MNTPHIAQNMMAFLIQLGIKVIETETRLSNRRSTISFELMIEFREDGTKIPGLCIFADYTAVKYRKVPAL